MRPYTFPKGVSVASCFEWSHPPSKATVPAEKELDNLKLHSRGLFDEVKVMVEKAAVQLAGERMRVAGSLG